MTNESRPAGAASELMAASKTSIPQPTDRAQEAGPTFAQRLQWRRRVAVEMDRLLDCVRYPEVGTLYAMPPTREPE